MSSFWIHPNSLCGVLDNEPRILYMQDKLSTNDHIPIPNPTPDITLFHPNPTFLEAALHVNSIPLGFLCSELPLLPLSQLSIYRPGWPSERSICLCLLSAGKERVGLGRERGSSWDWERGAVCQGKEVRKGKARGRWEEKHPLEPRACLCPWLSFYFNPPVSAS